LVVDGVPIMTAPVPPATSHRSLLERLDGDVEARRVVRAALGRFDALLGGLGGVLSQVRRDSLEQAFAIPAAPWISLSRFTWPKYASLRDLAPESDTLLDLGCGYGPSSAPFLANGKVRSVIGVDENLFFLLLFRRYAQERQLGDVTLLCHDASRMPLPVRDAAVDVVVGASFFNHFACLKSSRALRRFFSELARLSRPEATLLLDMVPNRHHPFATEVNLGEVVSQPRLRKRVDRILRRLPTRWLPGRLIVVALWCGYRLYMAAARRRALDLASFKREVGKALPESAVSGLPFRLRSYGRMVEGFSRTELFDEGSLYYARRLVPVSGAAFRIPYFVLRSTR
jgi:SAM-dependent methyltransferase